MYLQPAQYLVYKFGGVRKAARAIGRSPSAICRWNSRDRGRIPSEATSAVLAAAARMNLDITPNDILLGRKVKK